MKSCNLCGEIKAIDQFATDRRNKDGRTGQCKKCFVHVYGPKKNAACRTEHGRAKLREWNRNRGFSEAKKERERRHAAKYRFQYPEKEWAKSAVRKALKEGKLERPISCEKCGQSPPAGRDGRSSIHAHHDDYKQPLSINWLCIMCHQTEHRAAKDKP